jgi:PAS domain-containing protein
VAVESGSPVARAWIGTTLLLALLAALLGSGPAGSVGGQLAYLDATLLGWLAGDPADAATAPATAARFQPLPDGLERVPAPLSATLGALAIATTMAVLARSRPATGGLVALAAIATCLAIAAGLVAASNLWWPPAGTLATLAIAAPIWNGRRLAVAVRTLLAEADSLRMTPDLIPDPPRHPRAEPVAAQLQPLEQASARIRMLRRLLHTLVDRLPHPAIVTNGVGEILLCNRAVRTGFAAMPIERQSIEAWLRIEFADQPAAHRLPPPDGPGVHGLELVDRNGRHWVADIAATRESALPLVFLLQFTDITPLRRAESMRDEALSRTAHGLEPKR